MTRILLVEDDRFQGPWIERGIHTKFPGATIEVLRSECAFRSWMDQVDLRGLPSVVIMDVMLQVCEGECSKTHDFEKAGFYYAGCRCRKLLTEKEAAKLIPVIYFSVLHPSDFPEGELNELTSFVSKIKEGNNGWNFEKLSNTIEQVLARKLV